MDFFSKCTDKEEVKKLYKKLCMHFHPDKGGDDDLMIELKNQYENWKGGSFGESSHSTNSYAHWNANGNEFGSSMINLYETKINERDKIISQLRNQIDRLQREYAIKEAFNRDEWNMQRKIQRDLETHLEKLIKKCADLENTHNERYDKFNKMTLVDKVRFVFGYE